ncbi:uncharacterized protein LOC131650495 [Vicia villosa]|uniref:uncharacterized protein LOC131650495 n=1 Tax=Vicia villosa TaxID=3911 RepID=UPI00273BEBCA|nr:uncharacterized protein LOC131650495 [Vicia villosa]
MIKLSEQDIFYNFLLDGKQNEDGHSILDTIYWVRRNGCVLVQFCPYVGKLNQTKIEGKVCLRFVTYQQIDLKLDLKFKKEKLKSNGKLLEAKIRRAPVAAQIFWSEEIANLKGDVIYSGPEHADAFKKEEYHAIIIVGYGQEMIKRKLVKYWVVRNSHGEAWGKGGYGKINRAPCHGKLLIDIAWVLAGITYEDPDGKRYPNAIGNSG